MPILNLGGECCLCPMPLGSQDCSNLLTGIAEAYYTCPKNITVISYLLDAFNCCAESEISAFELLTPIGAPPENLLQPINFLKLDDDSGAVHEFDDTSKDGNVLLSHTFKFKVVSSNPAEECALNKMLGRQVAVVIKYKSGLWRFINHTGGMIASQKTGNSNQSFTEVTISGKVNSAPLLISFTDGGAWADANLIPASLGGLINA